MAKKKARGRAKKSSNISVEDRRSRILRTALRLFAKNGVHATKMSHLAAEAEVDQPLILYYFPNYDSLFYELVELVLLQLKNLSLKAIEEGGGDPEECLRQYILAPFKMSEKSAEFRVMWSFFYHLASHNDRFSEFNRVIRETGRDRIAMLIYQLIEKRKVHLTGGATVHDLASSVQGIMTGYGFIAGTEKAGSYEYWSQLAIKNVFDLISGATSHKK